MKQLPQLKSLEGDKKKPLSPKQLKYVKAKAEGKSNTRAAMEATGASFGVAAVQAHRMEKNQTIQEAVAEALARQGITLDKAIKPIADGMTANRTVFVGNGEDAVVDQVPDHSIRLKASGMALNLMGAMNKGDGGGNTFNFVQITNVDKEQYAL